MHLAYFAFSQSSLEFKSESLAYNENVCENVKRDKSEHALTHHIFEIGVRPRQFLFVWNPSREDQHKVRRCQDEQFVRCFLSVESLVLVGFYQHGVDHHEKGR